MFEATVVQGELGDTQDVALFVNPVGSTQTAIDIFSKIDTESDEVSCWEIFHNPVVTSNGTLQTITNLSTALATTASLVKLYSNPIVSDLGQSLRQFKVYGRLDGLFIKTPVIELQPGHRLLLRRLTTGTETITNTWQWNES